MVHPPRGAVEWAPSLYRDRPVSDARIDANNCRAPMAVPKNRFLRHPIFRLNMTDQSVIL
jgi:hypothetical protein